MSIKNYRSRMDPSKVAAKIEKALVESGAKAVQRLYGDDQQIEGLEFVLEVNGRRIPFRIPAKVSAMKKALNEDPDHSRNFSTDQARRTLWKNLHDWVLAQLALVKMEQVQAAEAFLPFVYDYETDQTLSQRFLDQPEQLLLDE